MKTFALSILIGATAGCATLGAVPGTQVNGESAAAEPTTSGSSAIAAPSQDQDTGPSIIIPVTGGAPVLGIPLGGDMFLPVTGGAPVIGISTGP
jgi:hypothetical protein